MIIMLKYTLQVLILQVMQLEGPNQQMELSNLMLGITLPFQEVETLGQYSQTEQQRHHQQVVSLLSLQTQTIQ